MAATDHLFDLSQPASFLPDYRVMILEAIEALSDTNSSNMTNIANFIVSRYGDLPTSHTAVISHHLSEMKDAGELAMVENNFIKVEIDLPAKRGRGRPPKANKKSAPVVTMPAGTPRGRGRPPKNQVAQLSPVDVQSVVLGSGRPRGRPSKKAKVDEPTCPDSLPETDGVEQVTTGPLAVGVEKVTTEPAVNEVRRGRGRPPKVKTQSGGDVGALEVS